MSTDSRKFTPAQAAALIPQLERMLRQLQELQAGARRRYQEMQAIRAVGRTAEGKWVMQADLQLAHQEFDQRVEDAKQLLAELHALGCRLTDVDLGLVDFPADLGGESVYLCWRLGERTVQYFHRRGEGYAARRPLPPA